MRSAEMIVGVKLIHFLSTTCKGDILANLVVIPEVSVVFFPRYLGNNPVNQGHNGLWDAQGKTRALSGISTSYRTGHLLDMSLKSISLHIWQWKPYLSGHRYRSKCWHI